MTVKHESIIAAYQAARIASANGYLQRFPEAARPYCDRAYSDGWNDGAGHGETFAEAIRAALEAPATGPDAVDPLQMIREALAAYESEARS